MSATSTPLQGAEQPEQLHESLVRRYLLRNYLAHGIEGGLYTGGQRFVPTDTLGPVMVALLGGPAWLTAFMPIAMSVGYMVPQIFTAHWIEGMRRHMPLVSIIGVLQRLPYLVAALALLLVADEYPRMALPAVALAPLLSGLIAGVSVTAWQELVAKTIPPNRRSSLFAFRNVLTAIIGLAAGAVMTLVLRHYPGPTGYGILHLITFGFLAASLVVFLLVKETPYPIPPPRRAATLGESVRRMPEIIRQDSRFRTYLLSDALMAGTSIMMPFIAITALARLGRPESYLGFLVTAQMVGSIFGNLVGGVLGDRYGGKIVLALSQAGFVVLCLWAMLAGTEWEFLAIFFLLGCSVFWLWVGKSTLALEITPAGRRPTYLAIMSGVAVPSMLLASLLSFLTWKLTGQSFAAVAALSALSVCGSAVFLAQVREPRAQARVQPKAV